MSTHSWLASGALSLWLGAFSAGCGDTGQIPSEPLDARLDSLRGDFTEQDCNGQPTRVAWLGNTPDNTYDNATFDGAREIARRMGSTVQAYYCGYDPQVQLQQCYDVVRVGRHDAILINANDGVSIMPCVSAAARRGMAVVATDLPIGPDPASVQPQHRGQSGAVLTPAAKFGATVPAVIDELCQGVASCNLVYLAGSFGINYDSLAIAAINSLVARSPHIHLVGLQEAFYDQGTARALMSDLLARDANVQVVVAAGDQMARGVEEAVAAFGPTPTPIKIVGGGAGAYAVEAIRAGRWYGSFVTLPYDEGVLGAQIAIRTVRNQLVRERGIDPVVRAGLPAFLTAANLDQFQRFTPQWPG